MPVKLTSDIITPKYYNFHQSYYYNHKIKEWQFIGYRCVFCERTIKSNKAMDKHYENCKSRVRNKEKEESTEKVLREYKGSGALETNQI